MQQSAANSPVCPICGATAHLPGARFCGNCGASLTGTAHERGRPKYSHVSMTRIALSCPECGEPMRFGFRHICRRCGARLVMVPRLLHPNHVRVYVAGPRAAFADLAVEGFWLIVGVSVLAGIGFLLR